jgi:hypothetical protein
LPGGTAVSRRGYLRQIGIFIRIDHLMGALMARNTKQEIRVFNTERLPFWLERESGDGS